MGDQEPAFCHLPFGTPSEGPHSRRPVSEANKTLMGPTRSGRFEAALVPRVEEIM